MTRKQPYSLLIGLLGRAIGGTRSPEMHEREAAALGLTLIYKPIDFSTLSFADSDLERILNFAAGIGFAGVNVTYPFKQRVIPLLDDISPDAAALGAVNTIAFRGGRKIGHNVDWSGYAESFRRGLPGGSLARVGQVGAGGAGAATAYALSKMGCERLTLFDVDRAKAAALQTRLQPLFPDTSLVVAESLEEACVGTDGIVQATPVGMRHHPGNPVREDLLRSGMWASDVVYFPEETEFLLAARRKGCHTLSGGGMAVFQAAAAFQIFTGVEPDRERMFREFRANARDP
jgi:shikimate dehydrogenase